MELYPVHKVSHLICTPGKFEGEPIYVPALREQCINGEADIDTGHVYGVLVTETERAVFPELCITYGVLLDETDTGFVTSYDYETKEEFDAAVKRAEAAEETEQDNG